MWVICFVSLFIAGCERPDPATEIEAAAESLSAGNYEDAALRLNYVVQLEPENTRARELRGDLALVLGDYPNAIAEYEYALELGSSNDSIVLKLADAKISQGQVDEALELLDSAEPSYSDEPLFWILRAEALLATDRLLEAQRAIEQTRRVGDDVARALTASAQIAFASGDRASAFENLKRALAIAPNDPRVRLAHAELLARTDQLAAAAAEMERAADLYGEASLRPREVLSLLGLVQIHLARNDIDAAETVAARLAEIAPDVQLTAYYRGLVAFRRGRLDEAAALIQPLVNASPDTIQYRSLLGAIQLARGNVGQAEQQFLRVLSVSPRDPAASKLLAETRLRQQRPGAALDALLAVQDTAAQDPQIGLLSGVASVLAGNAEEGLQYLEQAAELDPADEFIRLQLARAYLATGRDAEASSILTGSFGDDARAIEANLLRLFAARRQGDADSSAAIAEELVANYPNDPRVLTAVAVNYQLNGNSGRARELFERAAEFDTEDATAQLFVAASLLQEGRQGDAENLLRQTLVKRPDNPQALAGLARLLASRGAYDEAAEIYARAAQHTTSVTPRLALVQMRLRQGNIVEARKQLDAAVAVAPDNPEVIVSGGIVALAEGKADEAVALLERASELIPDRLGVKLTLARANLVGGQSAAARELLLELVELAPGSFPVRLALGEAELQSGNADRASSIATNLKAEFPSQAGGYILEGRALIAARQYVAASKSFSLAFDRQPTWPVLALKIQALRLAGRSAEALDVTEAWAAVNPQHIPAALMRAVLLQALGSMQDALVAYGDVLRTQPENLVALNNAAWITNELDQPGALSLAERAYSVAPENAAVLDTFGWILLAQGDAQRAIEILTRAVDLAPQAPEIRYHLAEALVAGGQSDSAREILTALLTEQREFDERDNAERLLESI